MMFNGLLMCTDSDSDFTKESIGRSSEVDSPSSSCASARAQYYHNKLLATLQILQNKEETVRVQAESLAVAEARIASLTARSVELRREMEWKGREVANTNVRKASIAYWSMEKSEQITRLHGVINTQKWTLDKCQDIASDVDNLKVEISNFLNSSNNDSGVWEESLAGDLTEDLQDIAGQLFRLRELITVCMCVKRLLLRTGRRKQEVARKQ
ncbi:Uncharacterized protein OBRU01_21055 [Operophtera brumata]|uniref:Uncharacterized protein n=1 Tax=Operophtera brumata TaxID=104452 RepID=A0A0L7KTV8_OPEBR|nr:Uncharacterized protein OBRU01_21055 [Operophtera brumata]